MRASANKSPRRRVLVLIAVVQLTFNNTSLAQPIDRLAICVDPMTTSAPQPLATTDPTLQLALAFKAWFEQAGGPDTVFFTRSQSKPDLSQRADVLNTLAPDLCTVLTPELPGAAARRWAVLYGEKVPGRVTWPGESDALADSMAEQIATVVRNECYVGGAGSYFVPGAAILSELSMPSVVVVPGPWGSGELAQRPRGKPFTDLEGLALANGVLSYFEGEKLPVSVISGSVRDADTGFPTEEVAVHLLPHNERATVRGGFYVFLTVPPGPCRIQIVDPRYEVARDSTVVHAGSFRTVDFALVSPTPPTVEELAPPPDTAGFSVKGSIRMRFSRPMDTTSVLRSLRFEPPFRWRHHWTDGGREITITPLRHLQFDVTYTMKLLDDATDRFGHPLDGDADGLPGGTFTASFRTAPLDTSRLEVLDLVPSLPDTGVLPGQILSITFNKRVDPSSIHHQAVRLVSGEDRDLPTQLTWCQEIVDSAGNAHGTRVAIVPLIDYRPDQEYRLEITPQIHDLSGGRLDSHIVRTFRSSKRRWIPWPVEDFRPSRSLWQIESKNTAKQDSFSFSIVTGMGVADTLCAGLEYRFNTPGSELWLTVRRDTARVGLPLSKHDLLSLALYGDGNRVGVQAIWEDTDGIEFSEAVPVDWCGWVSLFFSPSDSLHPGPMGNGRTDADSVRFLGLRLTSGQPTRGELFLDRLYLLLTAQPVGVKLGRRGSSHVAHPEEFRLEKNRPNPFRSTTEIRFWIGQRLSGENVKLEVVNLLGQTVAILWEGATVTGWHRVFWDGRDMAGSDLPSGIYFARLSVAGSVAIQRLVLLR